MKDTTGSAVAGKVYPGVATTGYICGVGAGEEGGLDDPAG